ncbi:MAG: hypothetical protein ACTH2U_02725 [Brevibacterium sp.]
MSRDPNVSMGGGSFDFDAENGRGSSGGSGGWGSGPVNNDSGRKPRRFGCGTIIALIVILVLIGNVMRGCSDDEGGSGGGGFFFLPFFGSSSTGSNYGDGSGFRGGGPGTGK